MASWGSISVAVVDIGTRHGTTPAENERNVTCNSFTAQQRKKSMFTRGVKLSRFRIAIPSRGKHLWRAEVDCRNGGFKSEFSDQCRRCAGAFQPPVMHYSDFFLPNAPTTTTFQRCSQPFQLKVVLAVKFSLISSRAPHLVPFAPERTNDA